jgi:uncharacterized protein YcnI
MRLGHRPAPVAVVGSVAVSVLSLVSLLLGAGTAVADVVIEPDHVEPGARDVTLVFRMTDEDPAANTAELQVFLPTGRPLVGVSAPAPPGWTAQLTRTVLATAAPSADGPVREVVSAIQWSAGGERDTGATGADPAEADPAAVRFPVHVDLMPEGAGPVRFRVVQTDRSGRSVEWADTWAEGAPPPAHDALVLPLGSAPRPPAVAGAHSDHHGDGSGAAAALPVGPASPAAVAATVGGLLVLAAAVAALAVGLGRRQRRRFEALTVGEPGERRRSGS